MLGKLIKYDLKSSGKIFVLLHVIFLLLCGAGRIFFMNRLDFGAPAKTLLAPITIVFTLGVFLVTALSFCTLLLITFRFYRNLFGREGYLSWTLPVSAVKHLWAKLISGYLFMVIDICVISAGLLILVTGRNVAEAYASIASEVTEELGMSITSFSLYILLFSVIGCISSILMIYFSICMGQLFPGHRVLGAIAIYFITSFVIQIATFIIMAAFGLFDFYGSNTGTAADNMFYMLVPNIVFSLILSIAQYAAVHYMMKNKLSLI